MQSLSFSDQLLWTKGFFFVRSSKLFKFFHSFTLVSVTLYLRKWCSPGVAKWQPVGQSWPIRQSTPAHLKHRVNPLTPRSVLTHERTWKGCGKIVCTPFDRYSIHHYCRKQLPIFVETYLCGFDEKFDFWKFQECNLKENQKKSFTVWSKLLNTEAESLEECENSTKRCQCTLYWSNVCISLWILYIIVHHIWEIWIYKLPKLRTLC